MAEKQERKDRKRRRKNKRLALLYKMANPLILPLFLFLSFAFPPWAYLLWSGGYYWSSSTYTHPKEGKDDGYVEEDP